MSDEIIIGDPLTELVKNEVVFETIEAKLVNPLNPEYILEDLRILMQNRDSICQEYIYDKSIEKNIPLKNKFFSKEDVDADDDEDEIEDEDAKRGIYVMRQEGGPLHSGDNILSDITDITTQGLLEIISGYGYKKIIIIDYSCDICTTMFGSKPDDAHIEELKTQINQKKIGRGGKKTKRKNNKKRNKKTFKSSRV